MVETAFCSECQMPFAVRNGVIRFHTTMKGGVCLGSRRAPMSTVVPVTIRTGYGTG